MPPDADPIPESQLRSLPGVYALADSGHIDVWSSGDSLMIGALDATSIAVLAGHDSSAARRAAELSERATTFLAMLGSDSAAQEFMHASIPADARRAYVSTLRRSLGDSVARDVTVIGTAIDSPVAARSFVRVMRNGASEFVSLIWSGGMLVGVEPAGRAAYTLRLRSESPGALASFDLFTGHLVRVELLGDRALGIESNGVTRRAVR